MPYIPPATHALDNDELFDRAVRIIYGRTRAGGYNYDQPCATLSDVLRDGTVVLRNINGTLAVVKPPRKQERLS